MVQLPNGGFTPQPADHIMRVKARHYKIIKEMATQDKRSATVMLELLLDRLFSDFIPSELPRHVAAEHTRNKQK